MKEKAKESGEFRLPHPELDKRPVLAVAGLVLGILGWLGIFLFPKTDIHGLYVQQGILIAVAVISGLMSWFGMKRAPGMALVGLVIAAFLLVTLLCGLVGFAVD